MIAEDGTIRAALVQRWLDAYCARSPGLGAALVLLGAGEAAAEAARWPAGQPAGAGLVAAARAAARRAQAVQVTPPLGGAERILALPLPGAAGVLALSLQGALQDTPGLERAAVALAAALQGEGLARRPAGAARLLQLQAALLSHPGLAPAASALASALATSLGFERVSLGLQERGGLCVVALSHAAEFGRGQRLTRALAAAMQEALDQAATLSYPLPPEAPPRIVQAHAALAALGPASLLSVPLAEAGRSLGALSFARAAPLRAEEVRAIEQLACLLAPLIALKQRAEQPWWARATEALRAAWATRQRRLAAAAAAVLGLLALALPLPYRIGAPARLEGAVQRVLAAPSEGYLHAVHVRPGDAVLAGQVLAELAQQDLLLESRKWEAELTQHENSAAAALARAERAGYALAQARAAEARAQLDLVQARLARTHLSAPIDGLLIKGDLTQSLGAPVQRGQPLLTIAPHEAFRLIVEVDERDIAQLAAGQRGQLALSALPGERLDFTVTRLSPVALSHEGRNSFEIEAALDAPAAGLRPGLQGVAKIQAGYAPLAWSTTRRLFDWLRLAAWGWSG